MNQTAAGELYFCESVLTSFDGVYTKKTHIMSERTDENKYYNRSITFASPTTQRQVYIFLSPYTSRREKIVCGKLYQHILIHTCSLLGDDIR